MPAVMHEAVDPASLYEPKGKKGAKGGTDERLREIFASQIDDAVSYNEEEIAPKREEATKYCKGEPFGDEKTGRSKVVSRDVRDNVLRVLPSLMRMFFGGERVIEYVPRRPEDVPAAEQATDLVNWIVRNENDGFLTYLTAIKDGLLGASGIIKFWWDERQEERSARFEGLSEEQLTILAGEEGVEIVGVEQYDGPLDPATGAAQTLYDVEATRKEWVKGIKIEAVPPEEFLVARNAKSMRSRGFKCHRRMLTVDELVSMGYDRDEMLELASSQDDLAGSLTRQARNPSDNYGSTGRTDDGAKLVEYFEAYDWVAEDEGGIAKLMKACLAGRSRRLLKTTAYPLMPFIDLCPEPEPHTFYGLGFHDLLADVQRVKSQVWRSMLDSLSQSINPRTVVVDGQVNIDDVLNNEVGAVIRTRAPGMVQELTTTFTGAQAFPMMDYLDGVAESRSGVTKASAGLDPDAMQSTTKAAVTATVQAAQGRIELIARIFAEMGFKYLYKGILKLLTLHQDRPKVIRLRGQFVEMDPRGWDPSMDVSVNVGLGTGNTEERMAYLTTTLQAQQAAMQMLGPVNPLVDLDKIRNTLGKMAEVAGWTDASLFWKDPRYEPPMQPPQQQGDPTQMLIQVEVAKIKAKAEADAAELQMKAQYERQKRAEELAVEREKIEREYAFKMAELEEETKVKVYQAQLQIELKRQESAPVAESTDAVAQSTGAIAQQMAASVQAMQEFNAQIANAMREMHAINLEIARGINAPRTVVRDQNGRIVGTKTN